MAVCRLPALRVRAALGGSTMRDTRLQSDDLTEDVILSSDQTLLYALYDFLPLDLILEVLLEDELAMALSV